MSNEIKPPNIDSVNKSSIPRKPFRLRQTIAKISNSKAVKCQSSIQLKAGSVRDNSGVCAVADSESDKTCIFEKSKYSEELEMSGRKPSVGDRRSVESLGILSPNQMKDFSWIDDGSDPGSSRPRFRLGQELVLATWLQSPSNQQSASRVNPDRRSVESLGILTPNQIKDFSWINSTPKPIFEETPPDLLNFCTPGTKATRMSFSPKKIKIDKSMNATFSKDTKAKLENTYSIDSNSTIDRKIAQRSVASNTVVLADETEILLDNTYSLEAGVSDQKNVQCGVLECVENQLDSTYDLGLVNQDRDSLEGSAAKDLKPESITEEILNNTYGLLTTPADSARKKVQSSVVKGSVLPPSVVTSVTSLGSMDGYQGDVEGTGTQNTPVRLHPKKSKSGPSSEMETSGIFSDVELVNDDPESSKNRTVIRTAPQSDKSKLVSKTPSSRSSASSSLCSVATKISAKSPRLQNTKDIKDAANRSRKLPLPQTKVPLRKSTMPEIKPPTKARSISLSTKPPAVQLIPPVIPPRESPSRISYQRPPKPAPKPAKSIESEKLPNRRPGPYANGRQSMLPSARQGKSIVPVANSTPEGDAATGRLRRKTVFALGNTRKNETTFGSKPPSPIQKVLSNPPSSVQWKPQIQEHPPKKTQEVMKLENVVESLREELKRANLQKEDFCRLEKQNDELLQAIKALKDELDERKSELASKVSELNILHTEMDKLQEINRNLIKSIEAQNEAEEKFREQETELKNYYAEELKRTTSVYTAEIEKEKRENKSLMLKLKDNQGLVEELKRTLLLPVDTRYEAQIEKQSAEISSLHTVLAMRNEELKDCRAVARELQLQQEELLTLRDRLQKTELAKEDLFVRLQMEREEKRRCEQKIETLTIQLRSDSNKLKRVSMDKEQLEYRLSSAGLDVCGSPLARNNSNSTFSFNVSSPNLSSSTVCTSPKPQTNGTSDRQSLSPVPQSPGVMRRVVEKSESLSYVLGFEEEIDDMIVELRSPKKSV